MSRGVDSVAGDNGGKLEKCDLWRTQLSQMSPESKGFSEERHHRVGRLGRDPALPLTNKLCDLGHRTTPWL